MGADDMRRNVLPAQGVLADASSAKTVLFVDPDVAGAQRLADAIKDRYAVLVVPTAHLAWAAIQRSMPLMVVTELALPDANGLDLIRALHTSPATHDVFGMVITARTDIRDKVSAFQAGADDFLVKPVDPGQFTTHLHLVTRFRRVLGS